MLFTMEDETTKTTQHGHVRLTSFPFHLHSAANTATDSFIVLFYVLGSARATRRIHFMFDVKLCNCTYL